jgi:hypothetical protein
MRSFFRIELGLPIVLVMGWQMLAREHPPGPVPDLELCIHLYDFANLPAQTLYDAENEAAKVFATAGLCALWHTSQTKSREARLLDQSGPSPNRLTELRNYLVLTIERGEPDQVFPGALGFALPHARFGANATILYDRLERLYEVGGISKSHLLAYVLAHEAGHVLLGSCEHSLSGLMKAHWSHSDLQSADRGAMQFTRAQRLVIRERLLLRPNAAQKHSDPPPAFATSVQNKSFSPN